MTKAQQRALLVGGGIVALYFLTKKKATAAEQEESAEEPKKETLEDVLLRVESPDGRAHLGHLYAVQPDDAPLAVMREALFGSREPVTELWKRQAAIDLLERVECGPWNQANYAVSPEALHPQHAALVKKRYSQRGIAFRPIYSNNRARMMLGQQPTSEPGQYYPYIWIPMIDIDYLDQSGEVTLKDMNWPDNIRGRGHSMIDPPFEIIDIGFDEITNSAVGCELPDGDFRRFVVST